MSEKLYTFKPFNWLDHGAGSIIRYSATTPIGVFRIYQYADGGFEWTVSRNYMFYSAPDADAAKSLAEAHFRSCVEPFMQEVQIPWEVFA